MSPAGSEKGTFLNIGNSPINNGDTNTSGINFGSKADQVM